MLGSQGEPALDPERSGVERGQRSPSLSLHLQGTRLHSVLVRGAAFLLFGEELDEVVDSQDGDGGFCGELETLSLHHGGLVNASLLVVPGLTVHQIQTNPIAQGDRLGHWHK